MEKALVFGRVRNSANSDSVARQMTRTGSSRGAIPSCRSNNACSRSKPEASAAVASAPAFEYTRKCAAGATSQTALQTVSDTFLIAELLLDHILQNLAPVETLELREEETHRLLGPIRRVIGAVRGEQHIIQLIERVSLGQRFLVEDVERGAADALFR